MTESYGAWDPEALKAFSQVATRLAIRGNIPIYKSKALADLYGRLSHTLIRANARAILTRSYSHLVQQVDELCVQLFVFCGCVYICVIYKRSNYIFFLHN